MKAMESPLKMFTSDEAKLAGRWEMVYQVYADDTVVKNGVSGTSKHLMGEGATGSIHYDPTIKWMTAILEADRGAVRGPRGRRRP